MGRVPRLSKSRFQAGLQCPKQLWLLCRAFDRADAISEAQQALFDHGHRVGALGREYFPDGVLVEQDHLHCAEAVRATQYLLREGFPCIYEGAFEHDGALVRSDVVVRREDGTWTLVEVKSSTEVKPQHVTDLGIQAYVLRGAGLAVSTCAVLHVDSSFLRQSDECDEYNDLRMFALADVTADVERFLPSVPGLVAQMKRTLLGRVPISPRVGAAKSPSGAGSTGTAMRHRPHWRWPARSRPSAESCRSRCSLHTAAV